MIDPHLRRLRVRQLHDLVAAAESLSIIRDKIVFKIVIHGNNDFNDFPDEALEIINSGTCDSIGKACTLLLHEASRVAETLLCDEQA